MQVPVTFDKANRKKDRSVSLAFTTNMEISNKDFALMDTIVSNEGWLLFSANELKDSDVPKEDASSRESKPKIVRLKAVYFLYWRDKTDQSEPFDNYWNRNFEKLMDTVKDKLE
jgi:hypothetical protein